ncbi:MAG: hypothetical protein HC929_21655 [Leptolyngbyaceae cyanobacterium SM2_5_2]|nr:hypothetical protein [Leptolyngbyaceae cyanobacterium SM2_5_2]
MQATLEDTDIKSWHPACHITYTRDTWVTLLQLPSQYAAREAKLLCQASPNTWVAWVPDHGEIVLDRSHFYR